MKNILHYIEHTGLIQKDGMILVAEVNKMIKEITIERPDLGPDKTNKIMARRLLVKDLKELHKYDEPSTRYIKAVQLILIIDGKQQNIDFYNEMSSSMFSKFYEAFLQLVPFNDRKYTVLSKEEIEKNSTKNQDINKKTGDFNIEYALQFYERDGINTNNLTISECEKLFKIPTYQEMQIAHSTATIYNLFSDGKKEYVTQDFLVRNMKGNNDNI